MATETARAALTLPATTENYDVAVVNANNTKIDSLLGYVICTSSTRPSSPYEGMVAVESDTLRRMIYFQGAWRDDGARPVIGGNTAATAMVSWRTTSTISGNRMFGAKATPDTQDAFTIDFDGKMQWGPGGTTNPDVNLYRSGSGVLRTDGVIMSAGGDAQYIQANVQTIATSTTTPLKFDGTARYTTSDVSSSGVGITTFTLNRVGLWYAGAMTRFVAGGTSERSLEISNITDSVIVGHDNNTGGSPANLSAGGFFRVFGTGKQFQAQVYQNSGASIDTTPGRTQISFTWIRP